jgi:hypothetical protein
MYETILLIVVTTNYDHGRPGPPELRHLCLFGLPLVFVDLPGLGIILKNGTEIENRNAQGIMLPVVTRYVRTLYRRYSIHRIRLRCTGRLS